jgi:hypothetical protein
MTSKFGHEFLQTSGEFHPDYASLARVVDVLARMDGGLDVRLYGKPTVVSVGFEIGENSTLDGILVYVTGDVPPTVLAGLCALDMDVSDLGPTGIVVVPSDLHVVVVQAVVSGIHDKLQSGTTDGLHHLEIALSGGSVTVAILMS